MLRPNASAPGVIENQSSQNDLVGAPKFGNGPNTVSGSTVSNTELSEFFGAH